MTGPLYRHSKTGVAICLKSRHPRSGLVLAAVWSLAAHLQRLR